jgi:SAM-dependent methyltransferase
MQYEYPTNYARFYDLIYRHQRDGIDNAFFLKEINQTDGKILEIGVGTGRLFTDALKRGADIYGIDISRSMLDVLHEKLNENEVKRVSNQNIIDFNFDFNFDLIIAPFHMMMHILEKDEQLAAIKNVHRHLTDHGRFIFDAFIPDLRQLINEIKNRVDFENEYATGKKIRRTVSTQTDLLHQLLNITFLFEWDEDDGPRREEWTFPLRYCFRYELEHLIERSGFSDYKILGDYSANELNENSKEFIMICQKSDNNR